MFMCSSFIQTSKLNNKNNSELKETINES
ncbi:hypothetical protein BMETH_36611851611, partial [methanotrophic bacterial endosymbiont of Bathymodiolus sp.]